MLNIMNKLSCTVFIDYLYCTFCCLVHFSLDCASSNFSNGSCTKGVQHHTSLATNSRLRSALNILMAVTQKILYKKLNISRI